MFQVKDIHIIFRVEARLFFCNISKQKNFFNVQAGPNYFFGQKQRQIIFSKSLPAPPPDNEMVAPLAVLRLNLSTAVGSVQYSTGRFIPHHTQYCR